MPRTAHLTGLLTLDADLAGLAAPLTRRVEQELAFSDDARDVEVARFRPLTVGPLGGDTLTVSLEGGAGHHDPASGAIELWIRLRFASSRPSRRKASFLTLRLATDEAPSPCRALPSLTGTPMQADGAVTLVAASAFERHRLDGCACTVRIAGRLWPARAG